MSLQKLDKLIEKLEKAPEYLLVQADTILAKDKKFFIDENRRALREEGQTSEGLSVEYLKPRKGETGHYGWYSKGYEKRKNGNITYVDLFASGEFHKSITLWRIGEGEWQFTSTDPKYEFLLAMYGEYILGVNEDFLDYYCQGAMKLQLQTKFDNYLSV